MLAGEAVVAIWNDVAAEGRASFYDWHLFEHMAERVGVPGFLRGRRYAAIGATQPEFFTLYEATSLQLLQGADYLARLNAPTPWTAAINRHFHNTSRAVAHVLETGGVGIGGVLLTLRFAAAAAAGEALAEAVRVVGRAPRVTGAHLCRDEAVASGAGTTESRLRAGDRPPPGWFVLIEATDVAALMDALPDDMLIEAGAEADPQRGLYQLEHVRGGERMAQGGPAGGL